MPLRNVPRFVGKPVCPVNRNQISVSTGMDEAADAAEVGDARLCSWLGNPEISCVSVDCAVPVEVVADEVTAAVCAAWAAGLATGGAVVNGATFEALAEEPA